MFKHESLKPSSSQSEQPSLKISAIQFIPFSIQQPLKPIPFASEPSNRLPLQQARHPPFELSAPNVSPQGGTSGKCIEFFLASFSTS